MCWTQKFSFSRDLVILDLKLQFAVTSLSCNELHLELVSIVRLSIETSLTCNDFQMKRVLIVTIYNETNQIWNVFIV